ncbi:MAG: hypothetical protein FWC61_01375 [Proteobacteria bacterium]|nr:hypothetical protein [Pseudomonadota bacterium]
MLVFGALWVFPAVANITEQAYVDRAVSPKENVANKVTTIDATSTDAQYPSARAVYAVTKPAVLTTPGTQSMAGTYTVTGMLNVPTPPLPTP